MKNRAAKCPPSYKGRNATTGPECYKPVDCCLKANPVSPVSGAKLQSEVDYVSPSGVGLEFVRYYNSNGYMRPTAVVSTIPNPDEIVPSEYWRFSW